MDTLGNWMDFVQSIGARRSHHIQIDQDLARTRLGHIYLYDLGGDSAGLVIDGSLLLCRNFRYSCTAIGIINRPSHLRSVLISSVLDGEEGGPMKSARSETQKLQIKEAASLYHCGTQPTR